MSRDEGKTSHENQDGREADRRKDPFGPAWSATRREPGDMASRASRDGGLPERIGDYRILERIGEGGMGVVYLARQPETGQKVALKVIKLGMNTQRAVARFQLECEALAAMSHPSIARVFAAGTTAGEQPYFVMEHVDGKPITEFCDTRALGLEARLRLFLLVCAGVEHAHARGFIHRDIKPSNCLVQEVDGQPVPKLIDFGVARAADLGLSRGQDQTEPGQIIGTLEYMSPEQADGRAGAIDVRTDVYALGALLYELLVGVKPFDFARDPDRGLRHILQVIQETPRTRPSSRLSRLSGDAEQGMERFAGQDLQTLIRELRGDLDWIVLKALQIDREARYPAVRDLAGDVQAYLDDRPVDARPPALRYRARKYFKRHRSQAGLVAAILLISVLAALWVLADMRMRTNRQLELARGLLHESRRSLAALGDLDRERESRQGTLERIREERESWQPVWERAEEIDSWSRVKAIDRRVAELYSRIVQDLSRALEVARPDRELELAVRRDLEATHWIRYREAVRKGSVELSSEFFRGLIESLGLPTHREELERQAHISITSDPPGASIHCFRYRDHEGRLLPIPFDPRAGLDGVERGFLGRPFLRVEKVWSFAPPGCPFKAGDRWVEVNGTAVESRGDVAERISGAAAGERVAVKVLRDGKPLTVDWVPFPPGGRTEPGRTAEFYHQHGITFEGYPLDDVEGALIGTTEANRPLEVVLPAGSYLLVARSPGHTDARFPLSIVNEDQEVEIRMVPGEDVPDGFVYVPRGPVSFGGDDGAYDGLRRGEDELDAFFLGRTEVTFGEYIAFLDDPETRSRMDEHGRVLPRVDWNGETWRPFQLGSRYPEGGRVALLPAGSWLVRSGERHELSPKVPVLPDAPACSVSMLAAAEYAEWLGRQPGNERWRFRLPRDIEWERAARGVDRRIHVWGNYHVWCFSRTTRGTRGLWSALTSVNSCPYDESVFGIRDLAGSVQEPVLEIRNPRFRMNVWRGGEWSTIDPRDFRAATRNHGPPEAGRPARGFRLAADLRRWIDGSLDPVSSSR